VEKLSQAAILLRHGANPDASDSSGNSVAHYAAAFGWHECITLLHAAGADFSTSNLSKLTPLSAAMRKGHRSTIRQLLDNCGINVNLRDADGKTLLLEAVEGSCTADTLEEVSYLVQTKHADPTIADAKGTTLSERHSAGVFVTQRKNMPHVRFSRTYQQRRFR
jgi:ankyrin repeat protein